jgi:hypothetical protein
MRNLLRELIADLSRQKQVSKCKARITEIIQTEKEKNSFKNP